MEVRTKELDFLLTNYWCVKEENPNMYFNIKNNLDYYKSFIQDRLGSKLIVNDRFIKLEKIPAVPKAYMGIENFNDKLEYIILMIILIFLEDKPKLEQFILSNLLDFITNTASSLKLNSIPNWNILHHRKCLVDVINHLKDLHIIRVVEEQSVFTDDMNAEALYETTGISNYYVKEFKNNILEYTSIKDYIQDEFNEQNEDLGDVRRYRVFRHLLYSLVSYTEDLSLAEMDYLKKFRNWINSEISKYSNSDLELTKNMAILLLESDDAKRLDFPNNKAISDIVLLINKEIVNKVEENKLSLEQDESILISKDSLIRIIKDVRTEYLSYFSKKYRDMRLSNFINEVLDYMEMYDFIRKSEDGYKIYPVVNKFNGYILKEDKEQIELFGDDVDEEI